ncbi:peptide-methionine (R)-S-oxide reductase MsrB [Croceibacterium sp. LX-88]|jgi:peptide-methionine (R)-S-oxide reductase|uniref:peptide-methionine (R)-S-oxide reductase n=1 Tax=Croceibacterium selenioxidans TaxID=2838833 RepID=A0ABS5W8K5_9SPHN|nr:peptide-methionine (R)-S-oxide reductase MsrB [Croceibacterium selenioxidans]MBT2135417.1 peptide-methionine (R)-S-oxide reductase MsrB [Croceibacterium selenioxidans]
MTHPTSRRNAIAWLAAGIALPVLASCGGAAEAKTFKVNLTDAEWKRRLSPAAYQVLRHEDTERAGSSPLDHEKRKGTFLCAGCANELYASSTKFNSGTGWPSFYQPLPGAVGTSTDYKLGYPRTEVHCADCGGHLGHVFKDGPPPTGLRYCMNGLAMKFRPA